MEILITIDPRHLRLFLAVAEHGSFNRAATALGISQPALSLGIAQLERQLGTRVLERGPQGAVLNEYGALLMRHARAVEAVLTDASAEIELRKQGLDGRLAIGGSPIALAGLVPRALEYLDRASDRLSVTLVESVEEDLLDLLRSDRLDIVVCTVGFDAVPSDIEEEALQRVPLDVVVSLRSPYAGSQRLSLRDLREARWAVPAPGGVFRRQVEALFTMAGERFPAASVECGSMMAMKAVVGATDCVALLPGEAVTMEVRAGALRIIRLADPPAERFIGIRHRRNRSPSALSERFTAALRAAAVP